MSLNTILATAPLATTGFHIKATGTTLGNSLIWDNGTNVGIGNTNTSYTLDVSGTVRGTTSAYFATTSGSVGIGTTSPVQKLQVDATTGDGIYLNSFLTTTGAADTGAVLSFGLNDGSNNRDAGYIKTLKENGTSGNYASYMSFFTRPNGSGLAERMRITSAGNVGIGTSSPVGLLQLNGSIVNSADAATLTIKQSSTTYTNGIYLERGGERNGYHIYIGGDLDALTFRRNYVGTQSVVMSLTRDGNVGIGTSSPSNFGTFLNTTLQATGAAGVNFDFKTSAGTREGALLLSSGTLFGLLSITSIPLIFGTNDTERMRITSGGTSTVLLGKTTSLYATTSRASLEINGVDTSILALTRTNDATATAYIYYAADNNIYFQNNKAGGAIYIQSGNSGGVQLTAGSTAFAPQSDERLKNIQGNIENAIDKLSTLRTVIYSWKSDEENKENLGLIAQDVQKVFPQVIEKSIIKEDPINGISDDTTQYLSLKYTDLIPVLVKAIQEQQIQIQNLQEQINILAK